MNDDDPIARALAALPERGPGIATRDRVRRRALAELGAPSLSDTLRRTWGTVVVPVVVTSFAAAYLAWAVHVAASIRS